METRKSYERIKKVGKPLDEENLKAVSGGLGDCGSNGLGWIYGTVHDVDLCLTLRSSPGGDVMCLSTGQTIDWHNGQSILVQPCSRMGNWIRADWNGTNGWVNANYVWY